MTDTNETRFNFIEYSKRISDWLIRQSKVVENIQEGILKVLENNFDLDHDTLVYVGGLLTISTARYKESELDMITVKAVKECISMFELNLLIEKYQKYKNVMRKWNDINNKLEEKTEMASGRSILKHLTFLIRYTKLKLIYLVVITNSLKY